MILDELVLTDFGAFAGRQAVPLTPREDRPVVVIGALNGTGKTTILEALQLALFGALAPQGSRRGLSYDAFLAQTINDSQDAAVGASVELAFRAHFEGELQELRVTRRWWRSGSGRMREDVQVMVAGEPDTVLSSNWTEYVEAFVPRGVAGLFFFDGEQIEAFADLDGSRDLLQTAINGLLGLGLVDRLVADLEILERRKRVASVEDTETAAHIDNLTNIINRMRESEAATRQRVDEARARLARAREQERQADSLYEREGGAQHERRADLETARADASAGLAVAASRLVDSCSDAAPLLLVEGLLLRTADQARDEQRQTQDQSLVKVLAERDAQVAALLKRLVRRGATDKLVLAEVTSMLDTDREQRTKPSTSARLCASNETTAMVAKLGSGELAEQRSLLQTLLRDHSKASNALDKAERELASVPTADALEDLLLERERARTEVRAAGQALESMQQELEREHTARERCEKNRERTLQEAARNSLMAEDTNRLLEHSERARLTLRRLREAATRRHAAQIRAHVLDATHILLRKRRLVADIDIDPVSYQLTLLDKDGGEVAPARLSAGERQMVAVSLLWGLAKAAGRPLPVVIDTPLGRLDGTHRLRFVESYLPNASHQVIVLSTDTEIDSAALDRLGDAISHTVHLVHDGDSGASRVETGYVVPLVRGMSA